ncbi:hypothetical protein DNTS_001192 [Danionella cerebrum]|uniref:Uncharacterized protein n=1 Tax=Danionella cerebrum TaxID=2873325 RepID=A0A553Q5Z5_9TELE|nr:hypothetical protein DNTS_001192 [Danionella translucida]
MCVTSLMPFWTLLCLLFIAKGWCEGTKCCYEASSNNSFIFRLSHPARENCTATWSAKDIVMIDEYGDKDENKVLRYEPQELTLKGNLVKELQPVIYHEDCLPSGKAYKAECHATYNGTTIPTGDHNNYSIITVSTVFILVIIVVIIVVIIIKCCQQKCKGAQLLILSLVTCNSRECLNKDATRCTFRAVASNEKLNIQINDESHGELINN